MSSKYNELKNKVLFGKYSLDKIIGKGSFGCVFHGTNIKDNSEVAIKVEIKNFKEHLLEKECNFLLLLKGYGIPDVKSYGRSGQFYALVLELLGINIKELKKIKKNFSLKDISMLAIQIIDRIEYVHSKYIVHRDIKPENFILGYRNSSTIYIIDFGISKKYRSSRTGKHIRYSKTGKMFGTIRYCTYNASRGLEQSRRDDLESIGYMLIFLAKGDLPWMNIKGNTIKKRYLHMLNLKKNTSAKTLCQDLPNEFLEYLKYCKNLKFEENPDYEYLRNLFRKILMNLDEINDKRFSTFSKINILTNIIRSKDIDLSKDKYINLLRRKESSHKRLYRAIQKSLEKDDKSHRKTKTFLDLSSDKKTNRKLRDRSEDAIRKKKFGTIDSNISKDITSVNSRYVMYNMNVMEFQEDDNAYDQLNIEPSNSKNKTNKNSPDKENSFDVINNKNNQDIKSFDHRSNYFKKKSLILLLKEKNKEKENINANSTVKSKLFKKKFNLSIDLDKNFINETEAKIFYNKNRFYSAEKRKNLNKKIKVNFKEQRRKIFCKSIYLNIINKIKNNFVTSIIERKKEKNIDNISIYQKTINKTSQNQININKKKSSEFSIVNKNSNPILKDNKMNYNNINDNKTKFIKANNNLKKTKINSENINFDINTYLNKRKMINNEGKVNIIINNNLNGFNNILSNDIIDCHQNMNSKYNNESYKNLNNNNIIKRNILNKKNNYKIYNNDDIITNDFGSYCYISKNSNNKIKKDNSQLKQHDSEKSFKIYNENNNRRNMETQNKYINMTNNNLMKNKNEQNKRKIKLLEYKSIHNDTEKSLYLKKDNINNKFYNNKTNNDYGKNIYNLKENFIRNKNNSNNIDYSLISKKMFEANLINSNQMRTPNRHYRGNNNKKMILTNNYENGTVATSPISNFSYVNSNQKYKFLTYTNSPSNNINSYKYKQQTNRKYIPKMNSNQTNYIGLFRENSQFYSPRSFKKNDKMEYRLNARSADIKRNIDVRSTSRTRRNKCINFNLDTEDINHIPVNINRLNNINNINNYARTKFFNMINV